MYDCDITIPCMHTAISSEAGPLTDAVFADDITSEAQWVDIVQRLQDNGYPEAVVDILAAITVQGAVNSARSITQQLQLQGDNEVSMGGGEEEEVSGRGVNEAPHTNSEQTGQDPLHEGSVTDAAKDS